jgi:hypothetical protein
MAASRKGAFLTVLRSLVTNSCSRISGPDFAGSQCDWAKGCLSFKPFCKTQSTQVWRGAQPTVRSYGPRLCCPLSCLVCLSKLWFEDSLGQKNSRHPISKEVMRCGVTCHPSYSRKHIKWENSRPGRAGQKLDPHLQTNQCKKDWRVWLKLQSICFASGRPWV